MYAFTLTFSFVRLLTVIIRPTTMDLLKATLNIFNHCKTMLKASGKMRWMKEVMKPFNKFKYVPHATCRVFIWPKQAREIHAPQGEWATGNTEREREVDKAGTLGRLRLAAWIFIILIIWTQLFHFKLFFYFFTKIHDFFFL